MTFDKIKEFNNCKNKLLEIFSAPESQVQNELLKWVEIKSKSGWTKRNIYDVMVLLSGVFNKMPDGDESERLYDLLANFTDGFTAWGKLYRILPDEPDIEPTVALS